MSIEFQLIEPTTLSDFKDRAILVYQNFANDYRGNHTFPISGIEPFLYTEILQMINMDASMRWNFISSSAKFQYTRMTLTLKWKRCGCLYEMKFYIHHLQKFWYIRMTLSLKSEKCGCLPLWDEILYSSFAKFRYTKMTLSLKLEKYDCLNEMKFYIHHL